MLHRAWARSSNPAATLEQVGEMKEYIEQALANIAYSITHATQKVDTGGWIPQLSPPVCWLPPDAPPLHADR